MKLDHYIEKMLKHANSMHDAFKEYCKAAKEGGLTSNEAWQYIYAKLKNQIPKSTLYEWGNAELLGGMKKTKPISKKIPDPGSRKFQISIPANDVWDFIIDYSTRLDREKKNHFVSM